MRLFASIGGLIVLVLTALAVAPYFIAWDDYRDRFEHEATALTGVPVSVGGAVAVRILPTPVVSFEDVTVGDPADPLARIERLQASADLAPFLTGEVRIFEMALVRPDLHLELDEAGQPVLARLARTPDRLSGMVQAIAIDNARIEQGSAMIVRPGVEPVRLTNINGIFGADGLRGPMRFDGALAIDGAPAEVTLATGTPADGVVSVRTTTRWPRRGTEVSTTGLVGPWSLVAPEDESDPGASVIAARPQAPETLAYAGRFDVSPLSDDMDEDVLPFLIEGSFSTHAGGLAIDQYRAAFGNGDDPYTVEGDFDLKGGAAPSYRLTARGTQVSIDTDAVAAGGTGPVAGGLKERLDRIGGVLPRLPLPDVAGTVSARIPALRAGETVIRDLVLEAVPGPEPVGPAGPSWSITRFEAQLPGRTVVEGSGDLLLPARDGTLADLSFEGPVVLASRQPSGFADWAGLGAAAPIRAVSRAGFQGDVSMGADRQVIDKLIINLDAEQMTGRVERIVGGLARPNLLVVLEGDAISESFAAPFAAMLDADQGLAGGHDIDLSLEVASARFETLSAQRVDLDARLRNGIVDIDGLSVGNFLGATMAATGRLEQGDGWSLESIDLTATAPQASTLLVGLARTTNMPGLADHVASVAANDPAALSDLAVSVKGRLEQRAGADTPLADIAVQGQLAGGKLVLALTTAARVGADGEAGPPAVSISGTISNYQAARLLALADLPVGPESGLGAGEVSVRVRGNALDGFDAALDALIDERPQSFEGRIALEPGFRETVVAVDGRLGIDLPDAGLVAGLAGFPLFDQPGVAPAMSGSADLAYRDGTVELSAIDAALTGAGDARNGLRGEARIEIDDDGRPARIETRLETDHLDAALLVIPFAGFAGRDGADGAAPFSDSLLGDLDLHADISASRVRMPGLAGPMRDVSASISVDGGQFGVSKLTGRHGNASIEAGGRLQNIAGTIAADLRLDLTRLDLTEVAENTGWLASGSADFSLTAAGSGRTPEGLLAALTGTGTFAAGPLVISGFSPDGFETFVRAVDEVGYTIEDDGVVRAARRALLSGRTISDPGRWPVTLDDGRLRVSNAEITVGNAAVRGNGSFDLGGRLFEGEGTIVPDVGPYDVAGLVPAIEVAASGGSIDYGFAPIVAYARQRALEREEQRIAALESRLVSKQRLRRDLRRAEVLERMLEEAALRDERILADEAAARSAALERLRAAEAARAAAIANAVNATQLQDLGPPIFDNVTDPSTAEPPADPVEPPVETPPRATLPAAPARPALPDEDRFRQEVEALRNMTLDPPPGLSQSVPEAGTPPLQLN